VRCWRWLFGNTIPKVDLLEQTRADVRAEQLMSRGWPRLLRVLPPPRAPPYSEVAAPHLRGNEVAILREPRRGRGDPAHGWRHSRLIDVLDVVSGAGDGHTQSPPAVDQCRWTFQDTSIREGSSRAFDASLSRGSSTH